MENQWELGAENTRLFNFHKQYLQGCKKCNKPVKLNGLHKERQLIGNCYQSLCTCSECGEFIVFDENAIKIYNLFLSEIINSIS